MLKKTVLDSDFQKYKYHSISWLQWHLVSTSSMIHINHVQKQWPGLSVFGAKCTSISVTESWENDKKLTRTPRLDPFLGSLTVTSVPLLTDLAAFSQPHPSLLHGIIYFLLYNLLSWDYSFLFDICLSSGSSKHSWTPALICRLQIHLNKVLFTEEKGTTWRYLLSTLVHLNMQLYKMLYKIS